MKRKNVTIALAAALVALAAIDARAQIVGLTGTDFDFTATSGSVSIPEGSAIPFWGYADTTTGNVQYPGPTMIVDQGDTITVILRNDLPTTVSIVFPGHVVMAAEVTPPTAPGLLTLEAGPGGAVSYSFVAENAGTYGYSTGTRPEIQLSMGLVGAMIVRPIGFDPMNPRAYDHPDSAYDREVLFLVSEMDSNINEMVIAGMADQIDTSHWFPTFWFINGRAAPDTMFAPGVPWLPTQPYNCMPMMYPGERLLMRFVHGGRDLHPFHHHGNHSRVIAKDGRLLSSASPLGADLAYEVFTVQTVPGETVDTIFEWTGAKLGWDIYGHKHDIDNDPTGNFPGPEDVDHDADGVMDVVPLEPNEYAADHGKPFPVTLPQGQNLAFGGFWPGSPFLGGEGFLPPGEGGMNPTAGYTYMWHSHTEKEMVNNDVFPGGMMTMLLIVPPGVPMPMQMPMP